MLAMAGGASPQHTFPKRLYSKKVSSARLSIVALLLVGFSVWVGLQIGPQRPGQSIFLFGIPAVILVGFALLLLRKQNDVTVLRKQVDELKERVDLLDKRLDDLVKTAPPKEVEPAI
jgi:hypothetical protein